jgi:acyl-CoA thioesterase-2
MEAVAQLVALLDVEQTGPGRFTTPAVATDRRRIYGGQLLAQAMVAAGRTVDGSRELHSLHAYFLRAGVPSSTIEFAVEPVRESSSFTTCRVVGRQGARDLLSAEVSFHVPEPGPEIADPMPTVPGPDEAEPTDDWELATPLPDAASDVPSYVDALEFRQPRGSAGASTRDVWVRARGSLGDDPLVHACVLAYASDKPLLGTTVHAPPIDGDPSGHLVASLDHSMWFHRPFRADDWMLLRLRSSVTGRARAFALADVYGPAGLSATVSQQGLVRPLPGG